MLYNQNNVSYLMLYRATQDYLGKQQIWITTNNTFYLKNNMKTIARKIIPHS